MAIGSNRGAAIIVVDATPITSGTDGRILYDNAGKVGEYAITGTGSVVMSASPSLTGTVIVSGATTTGPDFEVWMTGDTNARVAIGLNSTDVPRLSFGPGNAVRDTFIERSAAANFRLGSVAVDTAPVAQTLSVQNTLAGGTSNVAGANLTIAGSQGKGTGVGGSIIFQTAPAGGSGTAVNALAAALTIDSTKLLTVPGAIAIGGATISTNALAVTGTANISGNVTTGGNFFVPASGLYSSTSGNMIFQPGTSGTIYIANNFGTTQYQYGNGTYEIFNTGLIQWSSDSTPFGTADLTIRRAGAANFALGAAAVDTAPVAQTLSVQNVLAGGTSNVAGANFTINGSQGKGTGVGGNIILQTAPAGSTGTAVNALATVATLYGSGDVGIGSGSAIATTATAGFLLIPTCAGTPTGAPPNAGTGKAALIFDTTGSQLWISVSGASWKQPKTPAAAAVVNWQ